VNRDDLLDNARASAERRERVTLVVGLTMVKDFTVGRRRQEIR